MRSLSKKPNQTSKQGVQILQFLNDLPVNWRNCATSSRSSAISWFLVELSISGFFCFFPTKVLKRSFVDSDNRLLRTFWRGRMIGFLENNNPLTRVGLTFDLVTCSALVHSLGIILSSISRNLKILLKIRSGDAFKSSRERTSICDISKYSRYLLSCKWYLLVFIKCWTFILVRSENSSWKAPSTLFRYHWWR